MIHLAVTPSVQLVRKGTNAEVLHSMQQAAAAQQQAARAQDQAQAMRDQAQAMRDAARDMARERSIVMMPPAFSHPLSRRQEGMLFAGFLICVMAAVAVLYPVFRALGRRLEGAPKRPDELSGTASAQRLERIEQAVEAMAIEIERISEGQRFTTRLLSSRAGSELPVER